MNEERIVIAKKLGLIDNGYKPSDHVVDDIKSLTGGRGVERSFDCSASDNGRQTAIRATRKWGRICLIGEGKTVHFNPSEDMLHDQKTLYGSWVTSIWKMEDLVERIVRWGIHPADLITHRFPIERAGEAYALMESGKCGKVAVCYDEELDEPINAKLKDFV